ncbi:GNAT family N-acetyltransferase [Bizionia sediminis]|uniref:GNAT family N-acetyltransferase n=1 Tax=Bizionia sediminis TaxID=1737064 RepID=A0ABW5KW25_9FLAO
MVTLQGNLIYLRALEPEDLDFIFTIENDETIWELSSTQTPYSKYVLKNYLENAHLDIYDAKQLRLVIVNKHHAPVGLIDLFDFDFKNKRAGVGIVVYHKKDRHAGYGTEALKLVTQYAKTHLNLHQLFCNIEAGNTASLHLFKQQGFTSVGLKKDWNYANGTFKSEYLLQRILN